MNETIDLNLLTAFTAVAEVGSFTRAAERLRMPRATVSRQVAHLERDLGVRLFQRTTRRVSLSTAGAALLERIGPSLGSLQDAVRDLAEVEDRPSGRLRITAPADLATAWLPPVVAAFVQAHPAVSVELSVTNAFVDLVAGGFDCALRISGKRLADSSLVARKVAELPLFLYAACGYLAEHPEPCRPADLADHQAITMTARRKLRLTSGKRRASVTLAGRLETDDMLFAHRAILQGMGIGTLPAFLAEPDEAAGRLRRVLPRWRAPSGQLWMVWPGGRYVPLKTRRFHEAVAAHAQVADHRPPRRQSSRRREKV